MLWIEGQNVSGALLQGHPVALSKCGFRFVQKTIYLSLDSLTGLDEGMLRWSGMLVHCLAG